METRPWEMERRQVKHFHVPASSIKFVGPCLNNPANVRDRPSVYQVHHLCPTSRLANRPEHG